MSSVAAVSGLAASIRSAVESETFDLGGQNATATTAMIRSAFSEPLEMVNEMIRITFVTGAGKQARQRYDDGAARAVTSTLRELGFEDDRGASCVMECAGSFKLQHDTGKNLKTVVVFPRIRLKQRQEDSNNNNDSNNKTSYFPVESPEYKIATSSVKVFEKMLPSKCPSWSQKKGCVQATESLRELKNELESKLMKGIPLEEPEQDFYDQMTGLEEKIAFVKTQMVDQIENRGAITSFEKQSLMTQNADRIATLTKEIATAEKNKKLEKLKVMLSKSEQRKDLLGGIQPQAPSKLRYENEINKLQAELIPLLRMEEKASGRLLSIKETQTLAKKDEILDGIESLEQASRGWFEDDSFFQSRLDASRRIFQARLKKAGSSKTKKATSATTTKGGGGGGWKMV